MQLEFFEELDSPFNVFCWTVFTPYTNQRAELEAIIYILEQATQRNLVRLIGFSDSNYALGLIANLTNKNV